MTKSEKAKIIISILNDRVGSANASRIEATASSAAAKAGKEAWEREEEKDGGLGFGRPPYDTSYADKRLKEANENYGEWLELRDFVNDTFLEMIEDETNE
jgi:hypothetical protein